MFKQIEDFTEAWSNETAATLRTLEALTDESLGQQITSEHRTLGRLAWHLVQTVHEMPSRTGLSFEGPDEAMAVPASAADIAAFYKRTSQAFLEAVQSSWKDENLLVMSDMYGDQWPNGLMLDVLIKHEIHHRGQMTVLMRQAGLRVPDLYGPTKEQWAEFGAPAPVI
ncbi:putative damage-inducible protein DinB [Paenibacillus endophyticus]|uniref:Putative damage-inducible protein DinB n=1 Tax=Paenibacillus endophyticus TaxID=1294268 RepID=A0A7W5CBR8_9BACL|nr:DinB family protein [Paenibacillus endophyticus]MBB3154672.1 putative damage-inducible protein DinB [Paenibacillus endophyticus]